MTNALDRARHVIFDLDGTLVRLDVDWPGLKRELSRHCRERWAHECAFRDYEADLEALAGKIGEEAMGEIYSIISRYEAARLDRLEPVTGAIELAKELVTAGKGISICSNNTRAAVEGALARVDLANQVRFIIAKEDVARRKPAPDGLAILLTRIALPAGETVFIGDSAFDRAAGAALGLPTLMIDETLAARRNG
jgi:phosphoglycolate phosphatase